MTNWAPSTWWDLTIPKRDVNLEKLKEWVERTADRGAIAEETGEGGYEHYQCRFVYAQPTIAEALTCMLPTAHVTPSHVRDFDYIYKDGDVWTTWDKVLQRYKEGQLQGWQIEAYERWKDQDERTILVITDPVGGNGKSWLTKYLVARREAVLIPAIGDGRNLMGTVFGAGTASGGYAIDVPRSGTLSAGFWEQVEQIKNGMLYETRYNFQYKWIEPPRMIITTNKQITKATFKHLSEDRWDVIHI